MDRGELPWVVLLALTAMYSRGELQCCDRNHILSEFLLSRLAFFTVASRKVESAMVGR